MKVGLALTGGGATGACQVGMLKALSELGGQVDVLAGASVGALNAAVVAGAPSLDAAAQRLEALWLQDAPFMDMVMTGVRSRAPNTVDWCVSVLERLGVPSPTDDGVLSQKPLEELLDSYLDSAALADGPDVYVSVYKSMGSLGDVLRLAGAETGLGDTPKSSFVRLQSLSPAEQQECLLASTALPFVFPSRSGYSDGGQGGRRRRQGNTPVEPLTDAGCDLIVVMHTDKGSPWTRDDYPDDTFIEVRPHLDPSRGLRDLFEWDEDILSSWIDQGYEAAMNQIGRVLRGLRSRDELRKSQAEVAQAEEVRRQAERSMAEGMAALERRGRPKERPSLPSQPRGRGHD